jgi:N6-adenosine-specific RNA methylase IME4
VSGTGVRDSAARAPDQPGCYATLLADPPWNIHQRGTLGAHRHYRLIAADDAHLWLWVTNASLWAGKQVMDPWFTYRSILTWTKPRFCLGTYLRNLTEHLLLGTRGRAPVLFRGQGSWFYAPVQEHSHKPEEQCAIIERCSPSPYLELFARRLRLGWHVWGDEVDSDVAL